MCFGTDRERGRLSERRVAIADMVDLSH